MCAGRQIGENLRRTDTDLNPPAGWHPDPTDPNAERYWDGQQWTERSRSRQLNPAAFMASPPSDVTTQITKKRKKWPWLLAGVIVFFVVVGSCNSTSDSSSSSTRTTSAAEAPDPDRENPAAYEVLSERDFALLVKDPDSAVGRKIVLFGVVTQFDAATGTRQFRADTGPIQLDSAYAYNQNTAVEARDAALVADVVEDDVVKMYVEVGGSVSYDTQIGGRTTVPGVIVNMIELVD